MPEYVIDMLLLFKEIKFGYGDGMGPGDMLFFICGCTSKYNKILQNGFQFIISRSDSTVSLIQTVCTSSGSSRFYKS